MPKRVVMIHEECNTPIYRVKGGVMLPGTYNWGSRIAALRKDWPPPPIGSNPPFPCPNCGKELYFGYGLNVRQEYA